MKKGIVLSTFAALASLLSTTAYATGANVTAVVLPFKFEEQSERLSATIRVEDVAVQPGQIVSTEISYDTLFMEHARHRFNSDIKCAKDIIYSTNGSGITVLLFCEADAATRAILLNSNIKKYFSMLIAK